MAKAIGWYVHYTSVGYETQGTNPPWSDKKYVAFKSQRSRIKKKAAALTSSIKLEKDDISLLETLFSIKTFDFKGDPTLESQLIQGIQDALEIAIDKAVFNLETGSTNTEIYQGQYTKALAEMGRAIEAFDKALSSLRKGQIKAGGEFRIEKLKKDLQDIKSSWDVATIKYAEFINNALTSKARGGRAALSGKGAREAIRSLSKLRDRLNHMISIYNNSTIAANPDMIGKFYEGFLTTVPQLTGQIAEKAAREQIQQALGATGTWQGAKTEITQYDTNRFEQYQTGRGKGATLKMKPTITGAAQGKIDVTLEWRKTPLNITVKSYNFYSPHNLTLVSGSPLLYMIQDLNIDFVNHFLNLYSIHPDQDQSELLAQQRERMKKEMAYILLYKAVSGDNYGRAAANLFVVNDNSTGQAYVYTIDMLLDKLEQNEGLFRISSNTFKDLLSQPFLRNDRADTIYIRINKVLKEAHAQKITVSINTSVLKKQIT